ncbi:UNVERIFIED_ORG: putative ABC transport system permease protein [Martelella mediterranea]
MIALRLSLRQFARDPRDAVIATVAMVSIIVPLMLLWGLKVGFVESLLDTLKSSPANLEVRLKGDYVLTPDAVAEIAGLAGVGFILPTARQLATRGFASLPGGANRTPASLLPTAAGDPLTRSTPVPDGNETIVSQMLAKRLDVEPGARIEIANERRNGRERLRIPLTVIAVADGPGINGNWLFVAPEIINAVEAFVDGYALPDRGIDGKPLSQRPEIYSSVRLYAASIDDVAPLSEALEARDYVVTSNAGSIQAVKRLDRALSRIILLVAALLLAGLVLSLWSFQSTRLERMRAHVCLLALMGLRPGAIGRYFIFSGLFAALCGLAAALALAYPLALAGNSVLEHAVSQGAGVFLIRPADAAVICLIALTVQFILAFIIARQAIRIEPRELFRDL